jgi:hypothetical protein
MLQNQFGESEQYGLGVEPTALRASKPERILQHPIF